MCVLGEKCPDSAMARLSSLWFSDFLLDGECGSMHQHNVTKGSQFFMGILCQDPDNIEDIDLMCLELHHLYILCTLVL